MMILTDIGYRDISEITVGTAVVAFINGEYKTNYVEKVEKWEPGSLGEEDYETFINSHETFRFYSINGTWTLFEKQSIWANGRVVHVRDLVAGDVIYNDSDEEVTIDTIEEVANDVWYRFTVSGDHSYVADGITLHNASRYWNKQNGTLTTWAATGPTNWGSASATADGASVPASTDDVIFDGLGTGGNNASTIGATITVLSTTIQSGYTGTMTHSATLTIAGNFTMGANYTIAGASSITLSGTGTLTSNGRTWPNAMTWNGTKTLVGNWIIGGVLTLNGTTVMNKTTAETLTCLTSFSASTNITGTLVSITVKGGTWTSANNTFGIATLYIDGNVTLSGTAQMSSGTSLLWVSGTPSFSSSTMFLSGNFTTNMPTLQNVTIGSSGFSMTINAPLNITGTLQMNNYTGGTTASFNGTSGWTVANFLSLAGNNNTYSLLYTNTYRITNSLVATSIAGITAKGAFASSDGTNKATLTLDQGATCNASMNFTRIDGSAGRTITTWNGTVTNCTNVLAYTDIRVQAVASHYSR